MQVFILLTTYLLAYSSPIIHIVIQFLRDPCKDLCISSAEHSRGFIIFCYSLYVLAKYKKSIDGLVILYGKILNW